MLCSHEQVAPLSKEHVERIQYKAHVLRIPLNASIELTYRCNVDCVHCYCRHVEGCSPGLELTTKEWISVIDQLADLGALFLTITGGEMLMRPDFFEIAFQAKKQHFAIYLFTNGTMITKKVADQLAQLQPLSIEMSLLHSEEKQHDFLTQKQGSYKKVMQAARRLKERNLSFVLKTTLMKQNADQVEAFCWQGKRLGARTFRFGTTMSPRNDGSFTPFFYAPTREQKKEYFLKNVPTEWQIIDERPQQVARRKGTCGAAITSVAINPFGEIYPCLQMFLSFGNVREKSIRKAWEEPSFQLSRVRKTQTYGQLPDCYSCELISYCQRCHGLALLENGRWDSKDKQACEHAALSKEVNNIVKKNLTYQRNKKGDLIR